MNPRQLRVVYFTPAYDATVEFLRDRLQWPVAESWDRPGDHRGTLFAVGSGLVEVLENSELRRGSSDTASGGPFIVIEVEDVDALHDRIAADGVPVHYPLEDKPWGHRGFSVLDPNGVEIAFFSAIAPA